MINGVLYIPYVAPPISHRDFTTPIQQSVIQHPLTKDLPAATEDFASAHLYPQHPIQEPSPLPPSAPGNVHPLQQTFLPEPLITTPKPYVLPKPPQPIKMASQNFGALGATFTVVRAMQSISLVTIIGMTSNFISEMVSANQAPPRVLIGTLSVVSPLLTTSADPTNKSPRHVSQSSTAQ